MASPKTRRCTRDSSDTQQWLTKTYTYTIASSHRSKVTDQDMYIRYCYCYTVTDQDTLEQAMIHTGMQRLTMTH